MKDRLEELRMRAREAGDPCDPDDTFAFDNPVFSQEEAGPMSKVFQEGSKLSLALDKLQELSESIDEKQQRVLCCTTEESICEEKRGLGAMKASFTSEAKLVQPQLSAMHERLVRDSRPCGAGYRIRQNQLSLLVRRYRDILTRHYSKETLYVGKLKEQIARQAELAGLSLPEKDVEELAERPVAPRIVGRDLEVLRAKQQLAVAQVRHQQLLDLEAQITELHSLFLQLEVLVSEQHEVINNVEHYVMHTLDYVSQSSEEVKKALQYKRPSRLAALLAAALSLCACCTCLSCLAGSVR
ncbi:syntaxin-3-like [Nothoprocta perdicaria]|uniref:syntaxin-3-like n=1 Tax=Nothoprocta perdicaria TaxID=30464 RepID=UPI000E1BB872|nr:syntaxin-3-like [Nothoprocta perdicaria]